MKNIFFLFLLLYIFIPNTALSKSSLSGTIVDSADKSPIEYTNIILLSTDSTFIMGGVSNRDGDFYLDNIEKGTYILQLSFIGYNSCFENIIINSGSNNIGKKELILTSKVLDEITITASPKPFVTNGSGGLIANVSTTLLNSLGTATDVIQRLPGVVINDNKISIMGKGNPIIYINSRRINDNQELERLESSQILTVELITNPGAKYDATGRSVLIIRTKKKESGFSSQFVERVILGSYLGDNENISTSYSVKNIDFFASYYHIYSKVKTDEREQIIVTSDDIWNHHINNPYTFRDDAQQISTGFDWKMTPSHSIGGQYQYNFGSSKSYGDTWSESFLNNNWENSFNESSVIKDIPKRHLLSSYYKGNFGKLYSIQVDFDYLRNHGKRNQYTKEKDIMNDGEIHTLSQSNYNLYAIKLTNNYKSSFGLIEFGEEFNKIKGNGYLVNSEYYRNNNIYTTIEKKVASFVSYSKSIKNIEFIIGLRYEYTHEKSTKDSICNVETNRKYHALYPNLSLSKAIENVNLNFNFNKRVQRPDFSDLNGNTVYVNHFVFQKGNPYLKKVDIYDLNLQTTYKMFYLNIGYTYEKNPIAFYNQKDDNSESILLSVANYKKYQELDINLNFSYIIGLWRPNYTISLRSPFFSSSYLGRTQTYNKADFNFKTYNDIMLPNDIVLSCDFTYQSNYSYYLMRLKDYAKIDFTVRKSFLNNQLRLNLALRDAFNWVKENNVMSNNNIYLDQNKKRETRFIQLSIIYSFNNYKKAYKGSSAAKNDLNNLSSINKT